MSEVRQPAAATDVPPVRAPLHPVSRRHLTALTGEFGILQHASGSVADPAHGYCVDDVARALEVDLLHARTLRWATVSESAWRNLRYLEDAFDPTTGRFGNFRAIDGTWIGGPGSDDSFGRAMLGLATAIASSPEPELAARADALFDRALPKAARISSPRARAAVVLACHAAPNPARKTLMRTLATDLHVLFRSYAKPGWPWPEQELTYENALLPRAMIVAGHALSAMTMRAIGLQVLDWLIDIQTAEDGHLSPVGNGWFPFGGVKSQFDQQPVEATSLLLAAEAAYATTGKPRYRETMERAYGWFLGENDLRVRIASPLRGASGDALTARGRNTNEGAESTLMWLIAAEHIRAIRALEATSASPVVAILGGSSPTSPPPRPGAARSGAARASGAVSPARPRTASMQPSIPPSVEASSRAPEAQA
ncbi:MAG TPA: hypothetical protein VIR16_11785 [Candidatus Limnocylindrales bacterium]